MSNYTKATNFASKDALVTGNPLKTLSGTELDDEFNNIATASATKANASNAALTGTPTAPTAATSTSSTQLATTAHVQAQKASMALTGTPTAPTAASGTSTTQLATTAFVTAVDVLKAPLASPTFTGVPAAPTAAVSTNTTQLATTAFVQAATPTAAVINALVYPVGSIYTSTVSTNPATLLGMGTWSAFSAGRVMLGAGGGYSAGATGGATTDSHALSVAEIPSHSHQQGHYNSGSLNSSIAPQYSGERGSSVNTTNDPTTSATGGSSAHTHDIMQPYITVYFWKRTA